MGEHRQKLVLAAVDGRKLFDAQLRLAQRPILSRDIADYATDEFGVPYKMAVAYGRAVQRRAGFRLRAWMRLDNPMGFKIDNETAIFREGRAGQAQLAIEQLRTIVVNVSRKRHMEPLCQSPHRTPDHPETAAIRKIASCAEGGGRICTVADIARARHRGRTEDYR